ncbi:MAG: hypothetical protein Q4A61_04630 [Porphyromonadaceae bacterium]|nr:hypothetical protein [Porphyromonadaceae bacterium]
MTRGNRARRGSQLESVLTIVFYLLVLATLVSYFAWGENRYVFLTCGFAAMAVRAITYIIRLTK